MNVDMSKHTAIIGETQSGKTLLGNHLFNRTGGLFIDIEDLGDIKADRVLSRRNSPEIFRNAIKKFNKVKYVPSPKTEVSSKELMWIWNTLRTMNKNIYLYVDEIQNWGGAMKNTCDIFAIRGLKYGIHLVSISQRPAYVSKTIATQTKTFIFFDIGDFEKMYFLKYNIPYDEIRNKLVKKGLYYFVVYERGIGVSEPYKLKHKT